MSGYDQKIVLYSVVSHKTTIMHSLYNHLVV